MSRLLLQPASGKLPRINYEKTIRNRVPLASIARFLTAAQLAELQQFYPDGDAAIWGLTPYKGETIFPKLQQGDPALFYGDKKFYAMSFVTTKVHHRELSDHLWGPKAPGDYFEYVYFLGDIQECNIPLSVVATALGNGPGWFVMGAELLPEPVSEELAELLGLFSEKIPPAVTEAEYRKAIAPPAPGTPLEREVRRKVRVEQAYLRRNLFGNKTHARCALCGEEYSVQHLVTAHIKKRANCTPEDKLDAENIVLPMCKCGCDALFESRALTAVNGTIRTGAANGLTPHENAIIAKLVGKSVVGYRPAMEKYFQHHLGRI